MTHMKLQWINLLDKAEHGEITASIPVNIGRSPGNDLVLDDQKATVSRKHARIVRHNGHLVLTDRQSTNGTHIGQHRIGSVIINGQTKFTVGPYLITLNLMSRCSNQTCQRPVDNQLHLCPWCGRFVADAITKEAIL